MDKYVAYFAEDNQVETFGTYEEAENWLKDTALNDGGYSEETLNGQDYIAKITHRSHYKIMETRKECEAKGEDWIYGAKYDAIGVLEMKAVETETREG